MSTLSLKFKNARTRIEVFLSLSCRLSQLNWDSRQGRARTTSILVRAFWNFKLPEEVFLQYSRNCISQYILVAKAWHPLTYIHNLMVNATQYFWKCKNFEIFPMMKVLEKKSNFGKLLGPKVFRIIKSSKYFRKCKNFEIFPMMLNIWMVF